MVSLQDLCAVTLYHMHILAWNTDTHIHRRGNDFFCLLNRQIGLLIGSERYINRAANFSTQVCLCLSLPNWLSLKILTSPEGLFMDSSYAVFDLRVCPRMYAYTVTHPEWKRERTTIRSNSWDNTQKTCILFRGLHTHNKGREKWGVRGQQAEGIKVTTLFF